MFIISMSEVSQRAEDRKAMKALHHQSDPDIPDSIEIKLLVKPEKRG